MKNIWRGTIAMIGTETLDKRLVEAVFIDLKRGVCPLIDDTTNGIVGTVDALGFNTDGALVGSGRTHLEPGEYFVGMDLAHSSSRVEDDDDLLRCDGRFVALHVNRKPAWLDARITVEEGP